MANKNLLAGEVPVTLGDGKPRTLRFSQRSLKHLEDEHGIRPLDISLMLGSGGIPPSKIAIFIHAGLLRNPASLPPGETQLTLPEVEELVADTLLGDIQAPVVEAIVCGTEGCDPNVRKRLEAFIQARTPNPVTLEAGDGATGSS